MKASAGNQSNAYRSITAASFCLFFVHPDGVLHWIGGSANQNQAQKIFKVFCQQVYSLLCTTFQVTEEHRFQIRSALHGQDNRNGVVILPDSKHKSLFSMDNAVYFA